MSKLTKYAGLAMLVGAAMTLPSMAQQGGGGGGPGGGGGGRFGRGGGGNFNPAQFQQMRMQRIQQQMGVSDEDWKAIEPKLQAVMDAQRDATAGGRGGFGRGRGRRGGGGGQANAPQSDVQKALADLQTTLDNKDASADEIKGKLQAVRDARNAAKEKLTKAQTDLQSVLTQRQEAVLVEMGMLD